MGSFDLVPSSDGAPLTPAEKAAYAVRVSALVHETVRAIHKSEADAFRTGLSDLARISSGISDADVKKRFNDTIYDRVDRLEADLKSKTAKYTGLI